jgi:hypothetical protein
MFCLCFFFLCRFELIVNVNFQANVIREYILG